MIGEKIKNLFNLSDESISLLCENMEEVSYAKGEVIVNEGQRDHHIYFVESGFVRGYALQDGAYRSLLFAFDGDVAVLMSGDYPNKLSLITLEALEDTRLLKISRECMEGLFSMSLELANWGRRMAEKRLSEYDQFFINNYWTDKSAQYRSLIKEHPLLLQKVSLKELASYLNVTPQSLSRIRAKIK